jgi:hypothetical protein
MAIDAVKFSIQAIDKTAVAFNTVRSNLNSLGKSALKVGAAITGFVGVGGFAIMAKNAMDTADRIHKLNIRLGASVEALSQYRHVAELSGVTFETFTMGLQRMTRRVAEAANGSGEAKAALEELGVSAVELSTLKPEQQFEILADALKGVENQSDKVRLAMKLFDSEGVSLLQMMEGGAEGLRTMRDEADALGMTMDSAMVTKMAEANDAITKVTARINALIEKMTIYLAPVILDIADNFGAWIEGLITAARGAIPVLTTIWSIFEALGKLIGWVAFKVWELSEKLSQVNFGGFDWMGGLDLADMEPATETDPAMGSAAWVAQQKGGINPQVGAGGSTVVNNFNTQITRNDAVAIAAESSRYDNRQ